MKLNIQLFASNVVDTDALRGIADRLKTTTNSMITNFDEVTTILLQINDNEAYTSSNNIDFKEALSMINGDFEELSSSLLSLSNHLYTASDTYTQLDSKISSELTNWIDTFKTAITKIKGGLNSTTPKGSYSFGQYITNMSSEARKLVEPVTNMAVHTGNFYTSLTGKTVIQSVEDIANSAIGSIGTLFGATGNSGFTSIATSFVNALLNPLKM